MVAYFYRVILSAPPESEWDGVNGTITRIRMTFNLCSEKKRLVRNTLIRVNQCVALGEQYNGCPLMKRTVGPPVVIADNNAEEALVVNYLEGGFGTRFTTLMVNLHRLDCGQTKVSRSAVMNATKRMTRRSRRETKAVAPRKLGLLLGFIKLYILVQC